MHDLKKYRLLDQVITDGIRIAVIKFKEKYSPITFKYELQGETLWKKF